MHIETAQIGAEEITLEVGRIARQADGSVVLRHRDTVMLATVVAGDEGDGDFLPLTVDYRHRRSAVGRIPGNFFRRELRPGEDELLTSRLIDRSVRPLFGPGFRRRTQLDINVYSADRSSDLPGLALTAASAALQVSGLPVSGPVAGVRVIEIDGACRTAIGPVDARPDLDLMTAVARNGVVMLEGHGATRSNADLIAAVQVAIDATGPLLDALDRLSTAVTRTAEPTPTTGPASAVLSADLLADVHAAAAITDRIERSARLDAARQRARNAHGSAGEQAVSRAYKARFRERAVAGVRPDGRAPDAVRPVDCEVHLLPACHGSALFTRGDTQALVSATLGSSREAQDVDGLFGHHRDRFLLHYNFPGFAVGDARASRGPGRRETGHGRLAQRALLGVMPDEGAWPYTMRLISDITESDGSSSMATVCGGSLALLSAGVPIDAPVAGVAMGLVTSADGPVILTDITAEEDHLGDMDLKVAGTHDGITAIQLDNKIGVLETETLAAALDQAQRGRQVILERMAPAIAALSAPDGPRSKRHAFFRVNASRVAHVIGSGGRNLNQLQNKTGARIEVSRDGAVLVMGPDADSIAAARRAIEGVALQLKRGGLYQSKVRNVRDYGVFVRIAEHEGLIHQSEWGEGDHHSATEGQSLLVRVLGADDKGRLVISRRAALDADPGQALNR